MSRRGLCENGRVKLGESGEVDVCCIPVEPGLVCGACGDPTPSHWSLTFTDIDTHTCERFITSSQFAGCCECAMTDGPNITAVLEQDPQGKGAIACCWAGDTGMRMSVKECYYGSFTSPMPPCPPSLVSRVWRVIAFLRIQLLTPGSGIDVSVGLLAWDIEPPAIPGQPQTPYPCSDIPAWDDFSRHFFFRGHQVFETFDCSTGPHLLENTQVWPPTPGCDWGPNPGSACRGFFPGVPGGCFGPTTQCAQGWNGQVLFSPL